MPLNSLVKTNNALTQTLTASTLALLDAGPSKFDGPWAHSACPSSARRCARWHVYSTPKQLAGSVRAEGCVVRGCRVRGPRFRGAARDAALGFEVKGLAN